MNTYCIQLSHARFMLLAFLILGFVATFASAQLAVTLTPTIQSLDVGQTDILTANVAGTYQLNPPTFTDPANNQISCLSITINFPPPSATCEFTALISGVYSVSLTDANSMTGSASNLITVNPLPTITLTATTPTIDAGQTVMFSNVTMWGTPLYTYSYSSTAPTASINANSIMFPESGSYTVTENVLDSDGVTAISIPVSINVNPLPTIILYANTPTTIGAGQSVTFSSNVLQGTPPYVFSYTVNANDAIVSGNSIEFPTPGKYSVTEYVLDSTGANIPSNPITITVESPISVAITPLNPSIDLGQSVLLTANPSGGSGIFSYQWYSDASCTTPIPDTDLITYSAYSLTSTLSYCVQLTDSQLGLSPVKANTQVLVNAPLNIPTKPTISANGVDSGQTVLFTTTETGGTQSYTYNFIISNSTTNTVIASSGPASSNSYLYTPIYAGNFYANVTVTDNSVTPVTVNSIYSNTFTVSNNIFSLNPPILSASNLDSGQNVYLTVYAFNGIPPYTYNLLISNSSNDITFINRLYTTTANAIAFEYATNTIGTFIANIIITDSATIPVTEYSTYSSSFTVANDLSAPPAPTISAPTIGTSQTETFTVSNEIGGTAPYVYNFIISSATNDAVVSSSGQISSNTFSYIPPAGGIFYANVVITDSATTPMSVNSMYSATYNVIAPPVSPQTGCLGCSGSSGSGGGGGGNSGGGGGGLPTITISGSCYSISNLTQRNFESVTLNGTLFGLTVNYITPTTVGVTINGASYVLSPNHNSGITKSNGYTYSADLTNLSYVPIEQTVAISICSTKGQLLIVPISSQSGNSTSSISATTTIPSNTTAPAATNSTNTKQATSTSASAASKAGSTPPPASASVSIVAIVVIIVVCIGAVAVYYKKYANPPRKKSVPIEKPRIRKGKKGKTSR